MSDGDHNPASTSAGLHPALDCCHPFRVPCYKTRFEGIHYPLTVHGAKHNQLCRGDHIPVQGANLRSRACQMAVTIPHRLTQGCTLRWIVVGLTGHACGCVRRVAPCAGLLSALQASHVDVYAGLYPALECDVTRRCTQGCTLRWNVIAPSGLIVLRFKNG